MAPPDIPIIFNRARLRARRDRAAPRFSKAAFLKTRVADDIIERLRDTPRTFARVCDIGAHTGELAARLAEEGYGLDMLAVADIAPAMAAASRERGGLAAAADEERSPFRDEAFDLAVSCLSLHWVNDLPGALVQINRSLKPDGLFLGALFGVGTLGELRSALMDAEVECAGGAAQRVSPLPGLQDAAGLLQRAGFAMPVADIDHVIVRYDTPFHLLADLKTMGERAAFAAPAPKGLSRRTVSRMAELYAERYSDPDGRVRASFEILHVAGWAPGPGQPKPLRPGSAKARLAEALGAKEINAGEKAG